VLQSLLAPPLMTSAATSAGEPRGEAWKAGLLGAWAVRRGYSACSIRPGCCHQASSLAVVPPGGVELRLPRITPGSYRVALLSGVISAGGRVASDAIDLKQCRCLRGQQRKKHHGPTSSQPPTLKSVVVSDEGWQVVRPRQRSHSPRYLIAKPDYPILEFEFLSRFFMNLFLEVL
jgi:hypothetical protein